MEQVPLGATGVRVSRLVMGCAPLGGLFAPVPEPQARATVEEAWDLGVRAFDTAPHYGAGLSEQRLGAALRDRPRDEYVLSTKVGRLLVAGTPGESTGADIFAESSGLGRVRDYSPDGVRRSLEQSLDRLGLDRADVVHVHDAEEHLDQAIREAVPALVELREQGAIGAVSVGIDHPAAAVRFVREADLDCVLIAGRYTLLDQSAATELLPLCRQRGVAVLAAAPFNSGVLADPRPGATYWYRAAPPDIVEARAAHRRHLRAPRDTHRHRRADVPAPPPRRRRRRGRRTLAPRKSPARSRRSPRRHPRSCGQSSQPRGSSRRHPLT